MKHVYGVWQDAESLTVRVGGVNIFLGLQVLKQFNVPSESMDK